MVELLEGQELRMRSSFLATVLDATVLARRTNQTLLPT